VDAGFKQGVTPGPDPGSRIDATERCPNVGRMCWRSR
jgi:hypothetical protein